MARPKPSQADLENRFIYHPPPNQARIDAHAHVSGKCLELAIELVNICPDGRNLSLALEDLEDVRMRANAALACDSPEPPLPDGMGGRMPDEPVVIDCADDA